MEPQLQEKYSRALESLKGLKGAVVAFSGGVDSTLLLAMAVEALGPKCLALTTISPSLPAEEKAEAIALAKRLRATHRLVDSQELQREGFVTNGTDRCFFCKSELFDWCFDARDELEYEAVLYGATLDDVGDHRPGMRAARERGAKAPLMDFGFRKDDIRTLSKHLGLPTWDKPAMACLSSRFPYGTTITKERLSQVEAAERELRVRGYRELRVRFHEDIARIELGAEELRRFLDDPARPQVAENIKALGFKYVVVDIEPFRSGRLNEAVPSLSVQD